MSELPPLPQSNDEFWDGERHVTKRSDRLAQCVTHTRENYLTHVGYIDNKDGTATCEKCGWGFRLPGYLRIRDKKIVDLRTLTTE